jgi:hypothetical protein
MFRKFSRLEQRDMQALLDYSKEAWLTGKKGQFVMPDGTTDFLDLDSMEHLESEYGIFVSDSGKDQLKLDQIKGLTQAMMQNGAKTSTVAEILDAESFPQIKEKLKAAERAQEQLEQAQQQAEQQAQQQAMAMEQAKVEQESLEKERDRQKDIEVALINAEARRDPAAENFNLQKMMQDFEAKQRELDIKEMEIERKMNADNQNAEIQREANANQREAQRNSGDS